MIRTKKELEFYIMADRIMNGLPYKESLKENIKIRLTNTPRIIEYLKYMRKYSYYKNQKGFLNKLLAVYYMRKYNGLELELNIHINESVFGYGLLVPHNCSLRIGAKNSIGNFAVIQSQTFMTASNCIIGDGFYLAIGAKVIGPLTLGDNVSVAANSLVRKSCGSNVLLAGSPAVIKKDNYPAWYERDGVQYTERVKRVEELKKQMSI